MPQEWWPFTRSVLPLLKWSGGKRSEIAQIRALAPANRPRRVIEPFFGGGAVGLSLPKDVPLLAGDASDDLISLYQHIKDDVQGLGGLISAIDALLDSIDITDSIEIAAVSESSRAMIRKGALLADLLGVSRREFKGILLENSRIGQLRRRTWAEGRQLSAEATREQELTGALGGVYATLRHYSHQVSRGTAERAALFWFVREFAFNGMHRFNRDGRPNVPYGGRTYNSKRLANRLRQAEQPATQSRLQQSTFVCEDFTALLSHANQHDWIFLDPPYDSPFAAYDGNAFSRQDHRRLADTLSRTAAKWLLVIGETDFVRATYAGLPGVEISHFPKKYKNNIKGRFARDAMHLCIQNYTPSGTNTAEMSGWPLAA
jgi:DNA adenine methylase